MVAKAVPLSVTKQCALLDLPRSTFYHTPQPVSGEDLNIMALIDRCHLQYPFYGSRRVRGWLLDEGHHVNRKRVKRMTRTMDLTVLYTGRNLSQGNQADKIYPYLLRNLAIDRPKQVWCKDITYLPMAKGHVYLVAVMPWYSRRVL